MNFYSQTGETRSYQWPSSPANGSTLSSYPTTPDIYNGPYAGADEDGVRHDCYLWNDSGQAGTISTPSQLHPLSVGLLDARTSRDYDYIRHGQCISKMKTMPIAFRVTLLLLFVIAEMLASGNEIATVYEGMIAAGAANNADLPQPQDLVKQVNESSLRALSTADAQYLVPLGTKCLRLKSDTIRRNGMLLLMGIALRPDSTSLIEPYVEELEQVAGNPKDSLKEGALYVLANTQPNISPSARAFLIAHLTDTATSVQRRFLIGTALLRSPGGQATVDKVVEFAEHEPDIGVKAGIVMQLGAVQTPDIHVLTFIGASLDSADPYLLRAAVETTRKLAYGVRVQFVDKLAAIAENTQNTPDIRARTSAVLKDSQ